MSSNSNEIIKVGDVVLSQLKEVKRIIPNFIVLQSTHQSLVLVDVEGARLERVVV